MAYRFSLLFLAAAAVGIGAAPDTLTPEQRKLNVDSFEHVWTTVRDKHWDPKLGGLDWQAVHDELRPRIDRAATMAQARETMSDMLSRLKQTHFEILPAEVYDEVGSKGGGEGSPGIDVRVVDGHALVTAVDAGSPAETQGVRPGWEIVRIDQKPIAAALHLVGERFRDSTLLELMRTSAILHRLAGQQGEAVSVEFRDAGERSVTLRLDRTRPRGAMTTLGNLPPMHFWIESRKMAADVGYVRFNLFFEPETLIQKVQAAVKDCTGCKGFVVDLRGNLGGLGGLAMGLAGWFTAKPGLELGTMILRGAKLKFAVFPQLAAFDGPLAILVDGCSASTAEIFAGGLKDLKRARIFGSRTAAAALPSMFERLPNGDGFQYAIANYVSAGGQPLEGIGVTPDEEVWPSRSELLAGRDPALDRALEWIHNRKD